MKVTQTGVLEHLLNESLDAWERSKKPKKRASERTGPKLVGPDGQGVGSSRVVDMMERDGEPAYLDRAFQALRDLRRLWGIDAPERKQEEQSGAFTVADFAARLKANAAKHDELRTSTQDDRQASTDQSPE